MKGALEAMRDAIEKRIAELEGGGAGAPPQEEEP